MLQAIRNRAQGWIAWIIIILISIPFALFGIQEYLGVSGNPAVAEVNGVEIKEDDLQRRIRDFRDNMRLTLGNTYRAELFDDAVLRPRLLNAMIDENVMQQAIQEWNMRAGDEQLRAYIQSIPAFQRDGRFDNSLYQNTLRNRGMSSTGFEDAVRTEIVLNQLREGMLDSHFVTDAALAEQVRLNEQKRLIRYARIPAANFNDTAALTEEETQTYYQRNQANYRLPERVRLSHVRLHMDSLAHLIEMDETKLREYFAEHRNEFVAEEERKLRHILLTTTDENASAQHEKAQTLLTQLNEGADFAELAKTHSEDPGSAENGGDLGWVNKGVMVEAFEQAAFALDKDAYSEPVKTEFGYHIIQVNEMRGGDQAGFDDLRDKVAEQYRQQQAEELYYTYFERMADTAYENPDNLLPVAELLNVPIQQTDWLTRGGQLAGDLNHQKIINAAFSAEVLQGNNSDLIEIAPVDAVVVRVAEHEPASVKPLAEVKEQVVTEAAAAMAAQKAAEQGKDHLQKLQEGNANLLELAENAAWELSEEHEIGRNQQDVPAEIVRAAYALAAPADGATVYTGVVSAEGDYVLIAVQQVKEGDLAELDESARQARRQALQNTAAETEYTGLQRALRARADVTME